MNTLQKGLLLVLVTLLPACGQQIVKFQNPDGGLDAGQEAGHDAGNDGGYDAGNDGGIPVFLPRVTFVAPANSDNGVAINRKIVATFDKAMDPATIITANILVTGPGGSVSGAVNYDSGSYAATFSPSGNFENYATYTVTIAGITGVKDLTGNPMAADYIWSFNTAAAPDVTSPRVTSTTPADLDANVPVEKKIVAAFSKAMDPLTIITAN
ncbi:MAG: Ig-like domain-containing protein, partial [Myxococcota bacterium]